MTRIHAVCLNTAVDTQIEIPHFEAGIVVRSTSYKEFPSGKGVNSARAIACLGHKVQLHCITGYLEQADFEQLSPLIQTQAIGVRGTTRRNITIRETNAALVCHVQNAGYSVTNSELVDFQERLLLLTRREDVVIISGSVPLGTPDRFLQQLIDSLLNQGIKILVDVDPQWLSVLDCNKVQLVKPNIEELERLAGKRLTDDRDIADAALRVVNSRAVVVSLGERGALWIDRSKRIFVRGIINNGDAPQEPTIGCGDAMVGGFALGMAQGLPDSEILRFGLSAGYANLFAPGPGTLDPIQFRRGLERSKLALPASL